MDFTSSNTNWIWAVKSGSPLHTDSQSANLQIHTSYDSFHFDLTKARGGNSVNPFADTTATSTTAGSTSPSASSSSGSESTQSGGSSSSGDEGSSGGSAATGAGGAYASIVAEFNKRNKAVIAHGALMSLAFALFFPSGSILMRLFSFRGLVWVHAAFQMFTYAMALAGLGLGVYISVWPSQVHYVSLSSSMLPQFWESQLTKRIDWQFSPCPWFDCHWTTLVPAGAGSGPSFHLQSSPDPHLLGYCARLVRAYCHYDRDH